MFTHRKILDIARQSLYLERWSMYLPRRWSLKVHKIVRPDLDRCEHNHPHGVFIRFVLYGGYTEETNGKRVQLKPWRPWAFWRVYPAGGDFQHRIVELTNNRVSWSFLICGPKTQEWGFFTRHGFMHWKRFVDALHSKKVLWCEDGDPV